MNLKVKMETARFEFQPFSRKQIQVMNWWCRDSPVKGRIGVIADGSIRSGKTLSMSLGFLIWSMDSFDGYQFAMCGKTIGSFRRNVLDTLKRMALSLGYRLQDMRSENALLVSFNGHTNKYYIFGGRDERSQDLIQGLTLAGVLFDEVALMPESFVDQAMARCSVDGSKYWFNCNPEHPAHWFYKEWIKKEARQKKDILYLHFTMKDNLTISDAKRAEYERLYSGVFYDRFIRGLWVKAEGLVYPMFNENFHVVPTEPRPYDQYFVSCDYGTMNPFSLGLWGRISAHWDFEKGKQVPEQWYRIKEYYWNGRESQQLKTDEEYYAALEELAGSLPIEDVIVDPSAASFITCINRHDRYSVRKADNDVVNGIRKVATYLQCGRVFFNDCCKDAIREFSLYVWDEKNLKKDAPLQENDHAMDDIRYFIQTAMKNNDESGFTLEEGVESNGVMVQKMG